MLNLHTTFLPCCLKLVLSIFSVQLEESILKCLGKFSKSVDSVSRDLVFSRSLASFRSCSKVKCGLFSLHSQFLELKGINVSERTFNAATPLS